MFLFIKMHSCKNLVIILIKNSLPLVVMSEWRCQAILCVRTCASSRLTSARMHDHTLRIDKAFLQCENVHAAASKIFLQTACCNNRIYTVTM